MGYLTNLMIEILKFFYQIGGHNYGLAIIWLTLAINFALYPLTLSSIKQMSAVQKLQPKMKELQKKYKDEPQKLQKETIDLYKGHGVNPLGGCLPVLLKIPFFIALFWALQSKEFLALINDPSAGVRFLWITDLAKPENLVIMGYKMPTFAILIGLTTYLMQKTMPSVQEGANQAMMLIMPIFIAVISIQFPAGVQIYWLVSNIVGGLQQYSALKPGRFKIKIGKGGKK